MKKLLHILLCLILVYSCGHKEKIKKLEDRITELEKKENIDNETLSKELPTVIIKDIDSTNNKKKEINFLQKSKNSLYNQIKEDSIKKALLENDVNEQKRIARDKLLIKKDNEDVIIKKKIN